MNKQSVKTGLFAEARRFATSQGQALDAITVKQAHFTIKQFSESHFWNIPAERIEIWKKLNELFVQFKTTPLVAGEYFLAEGDRLGLHPVGSLTILNLATEKIFLLSLAASWLHGDYNEQVEHYPENVETTSWKLPQQLQEIEAKIIQVSITSHLSRTGKKLALF